MELEGLIAAYSLIPLGFSPTHAVDNEEAVAIHRRLAKEGYIRTKYIHKAYRSSIRRLSRAMLLRGEHLKVIHTLSHLEHQKSPDQDLNKRRETLAMADRAADLGHRLQADPYPFIQDHYALKTQDQYTEKPVIQLLKQQCFKLWEDKLSALKMEGANQRAAPLPYWDLQLNNWPDHLIRFRNKLWTKRIPTNTIRAQRKDITEAGAVQEWCNICQTTGQQPESQMHLLHNCSHAQKRFPQLLRAINLICRRYKREEHKHNITYTQLDNAINLAGLADTLTIEEGWTSHTLDKHNRITQHKTGPPRVRKGNQTWRHDWFLNILQNNPVSMWEEINNFYEPHTSIDPIYLKNVQQTLEAGGIIEKIQHNPHITSTSLEQYNTETIRTQTQNPLIDLTQIKDIHRQIVLENTKNNKDRQRKCSIIITRAQQKEIKHHLRNWNTSQEIPKNSIQVLPKRYWRGKAPLYHKADRNKEDLILLTSYPLSTDQKTNIPSIGYCRHPDNHITRCEITHEQSLTDIPPELLTLLTQTENTPQQEQLISGGISTSMIDILNEAGIPKYNLQVAYRTLHRTIVEHNWDTWLSRNSIVHQGQSTSQKSLKRKNRGVEEAGQTRKKSSSTPISRKRTILESWYTKTPEVVDITTSPETSPQRPQPPKAKRTRRLTPTVINETEASKPKGTKRKTQDHITDTPGLARRVNTPLVKRSRKKQLTKEQKKRLHPHITTLLKATKRGESDTPHTHPHITHTYPHQVSSSEPQERAITSHTDTELQIKSGEHTSDPPIQQRRPV